MGCTERDKSAIAMFMLMALWITSNIPGCKAARFSPNAQTNFPGINQVQNIIEAMIGAGDFGGWANVMYGMDPSILPITATFLVPSDEALSKLSMQVDFTSSVLQYHIVPHQLSYYDLQRYDVGMRLPTLLRNQTILVTSNNQSNYTLDDALLTHPDIYYDGTFAVHGVGSLLNFSRYGTDVRPQPHVTPAPAPDIEALTPVPDSNSSSLHPRARRSDAPCLCKEFPVALTAVSVVFVIRFLRLPLR